MPHTVNARIILRNDMRDTWVSRNPILARGELGAEIDTGLLKMGDGLTPYNELAYINNSADAHAGDGALITVVDNKFTVANYGKYYYKYNTANGSETRVDETDLSNWPSVVELDIKNGVARWVQPPDGFVYDKITGTISGAIVSLARDPRTNLEAATKRYVDDTIANRIAEASHLQREIVTELPNARYASENYIYMMKDTNATGADKYKEYMLIDGEIVLIGDTSVDLSNYIPKPAPGAFVSNNVAVFDSNGNVIDSGISANNINTLNVATDSRLGGVLSSSRDNFINVDSYGYMSVNNVTTDKITQGIQEFILNGGGA